jgi:hypothetical protein
VPCSVLVASLGDRMPRGIVMIGGVGIYGVLVVIFAASSSFALSLAVMALIGLSHVTSHGSGRRSFNPIRLPNFAAGRWRYSHDSSRAGCRSDPHRRAVNLNRGPLGGYFDEYFGDSNDGRNLFLNATCSRDRLEFTRLFATEQRAWMHRTLC